MATPTESPELTADSDPILDGRAGLADIALRWEALASKPGTLEDARVTAVSPEGVTLEVAAGQCTVTRSALGEPVPAVGEVVAVFIEQVLPSGPVVSLAKARALALFDRLEAAADRDEAVDGRILCRATGGLSVDVGMKAFLPGTGRSDPALGESGRFYVREWDRRKDMFVLAREPRASAESRKSRTRVQEPSVASAGGDADGVAPPRATVTLPAVDDVVTGRVARLADFGAFVDLPGGATGLLHVKDLSWGRIGHPSEVLQVGVEVEVKVLDVRPAGEDGKGERIALSRRVLLPDPWLGVADRFSVGQRVEGKIVGLSEAGAFVEVEAGVEAFVHLTELRWGPAPKKPADAVDMGDRLVGEVILIDAEKHHLKLSAKRLAPSPWLEIRERFPIGAKVRGKAKNVTKFGLFVELDAEKGLDGLVHVNDLSWTPMPRPGQVYPPGTEVEVLVLGLDEERGRCSLGIKQLVPEPTLASLDEFAVGQVREGRVARIKDFGAFIELAPGIDGLLHAGEMGLTEGQRPKDRVKVGQRVSVTVRTLELESRRVGLALVGEPAAAEQAASSEEPVAAEPPAAPPEEPSDA